ncbi:MAG: elongation factor P [Candidatus Omnitrophota bacterium]
MKGNDIRKGNVIIFKGAPHKVLDFQHRTPGNLRAFVQCTLRNILNGTQCDTRFSSTEEIEVADFFTFDASYMYFDSAGFHFMNSQTYDEVLLSPELVGDAKYFLRDGMVVQIATLENQPISVTLPKTSIQVIADTMPELKGATVSNSPKPATTESGFQLSVPNFIKVGEKIVVDTQTGEYVSRSTE